MINELLQLPKEVLNAIVYRLMCEGKISYHEIMDMHIKNLKRMAQTESDAYLRLQNAVSPLFYDFKKNRSSNIKKIYQLLRDEGRITTPQERIDKFK